MLPHFLKTAPARPAIRGGFWRCCRALASPEDPGRAAPARCKTRAPARLGCTRGRFRGPLPGRVWAAAPLLLHRAGKQPGAGAASRDAAGQLGVAGPGRDGRAGAGAGGRGPGPPPGAGSRGPLSAAPPAGPRQQRTPQASRLAKYEQTAI